MSGDLSVTALYTAGTWAWARLPGADLYDHVDSQRVFGATNAALGVAGLLRRLPSLKHGLVQRHLMIDRLVAAARPSVVLELAAGLSRRGVSVSSDASLRYIEIDRPAVIAKKRALLERTLTGRAALARPNWRLVAGDVADASADALFAEQLAGTSGPLAVVAEGLFMYLDAPAQRALWSRVHALLASRGGVLIFDLVPTVEQPPPGAVGRTLGWAMKKFTGGSTFTRDPRDRATLRAELASAGYSVDLLEPASAPPAWQLPHLAIRTQQLIWTGTVLGN